MIALDAAARARSPTPTGASRSRDLPPGKHAVALSGRELTALRTEETFEAGKRLDAIYDVDAAREGRARATKRRPRDRRRRAAAAEGDRVGRPGRRGRGAASRARRATCSRSSRACRASRAPRSARAQLVVWGAAPRGHARLRRRRARAAPLPRRRPPLGAGTAIWSSSIELVPGGYGAAYGRGLGGCHRGRDARRWRATASTARVQADVLDARGDRCAPRSTPRLHVAVAAAPQLPRRVARPGRPTATSGDFFPIPRYRDGQMRARLRAGADDERVEVAGARSRATRSRAPSRRSDPSFTQARRRATRTFQRVWARYRQRATASGGAVDVVAVLRRRPRRARRTSSAGRPTALDQRQPRSAASAGVARHGRRRRRRSTLGLDAEVLTLDAAPRSGSVTLPAARGRLRACSGSSRPTRSTSTTWTHAGRERRALRRARRRALRRPAARRSRACASSRTSPASAGARRPTATRRPSGVRHETTRVQPRLAVRCDADRAPALQGVVRHLLSAAAGRGSVARCSATRRCRWRAPTHSCSAPRCGSPTS